MSFFRRGLRPPMETINRNLFLFGALETNPRPMPGTRIRRRGCHLGCESLVSPIRCFRSRVRYAPRRSAGAFAAQFTAPCAVAPGHAPSAAPLIVAGPTQETHASASCGQQLHCVHVHARARSPPTRALQRRRRRPLIRCRGVVGSLRRPLRLSLASAAVHAL